MRARWGGSSDPGATEGATESSRVAPESLEGASRAASGDRSRSRRSLEGPEEAIWDDFGRILGGFSRFSGRFSGSFEAASRDLLDSQREGPHLCFYRHARCGTRFSDVATKRNVDEILQKSSRKRV